MIRLTWLQFRFQAAIAVATLAAVAIVLAITGSHLVHLYNTTVANCAAQNDCESATHAFLLNDQFLQSMLGPLLLIVPGLLGIFWGAPLIARELESGTYRLVWNQSVSRTRWLAIKLGLVALASMVVAGLISLMVTWWSSPFDRINKDRFLPGTFDERGIVALGYALFAFALGVTAGVIIRRTLPAIATTLVAFVFARLAMVFWIRPHLMSPEHLSLPVTASSGLGFGSTNGSGVVTFIADDPRIPNAWVVSNQIADKAGHVASAAVLHQFLQTACPGIGGPPVAGTGSGNHAVANQERFNTCVAKVSANYHLALTYQPANRYWAFQWYETAIFVALALALAGICFWWVRRRLA